MNVHVHYDLSFVNFVFSRVDLLGTSYIFTFFNLNIHTNVISNRIIIMKKEFEKQFTRNNLEKLEKNIHK